MGKFLSTEGSSSGSQLDIESGILALVGHLLNARPVYYIFLVIRGNTALFQLN